VVFLVLASVLSLPRSACTFSRLPDQLIQHTEAELIAETAALPRRFIARSNPPCPRCPVGAKVAPVSSSSSGEKRSAVAPTLDLANDEVAGPGGRKRARATAAIDPAYRAIGERMTPDLVATQTVTLAGFRLLDFHWQRHRRPREVGASLAHVEEIADALQATFAPCCASGISKPSRRR